MGRPLDHIKVIGFKSIREMDLELRPLNVLIGSNGAGKTNFISLFKLLGQMVEENLQLFVGKSGGADTLLHFGQKVTTEMVIELNFGKYIYKCRLIAAVNDSLFLADEFCQLREPALREPRAVLHAMGHQESRLAEQARQYPDSVAAHVLETIESWKVYHFHDTSDTAKVKQTSDINDNAFLRPDAANLAAFLYLLRETQREYYDRIVDTIRLSAPFFDDFDLRPSRHNRSRVQLEWRGKGSDAYFNAHSLSDGTLRFICLTTLLLQPNLPATILIDEPELGLHPYAITLLASMVQSAATKTQVVLSTQSVPLVNQFSPEDIIVVDREDGQSIFRRLEEKEIESWLEEYGLGDLWEKNVVGGRPGL